MRTVILDLLAAAMLDAATKDPKLDRVQDAWRGLEWRLCRRPTDGVQRRFGYYLHKQLGIRELGIPTIIVLYVFDDDTVTVNAIAFYMA